MQPNGQILQCFCRKKPILAVVGRDATSGKPYVHIKSARKDRINAEVVVTSGSCRIRCRDCSRWHKVNIVEKSIDTQVERLPVGIDIESLSEVSSRSG